MVDARSGRVAGKQDVMYGDVGFFRQKTGISNGRVGNAIVMSL